MKLKLVALQPRFEPPIPTLTTIKKIGFVPTMARLAARSRWPNDIEVWHIDIPNELPEWSSLELRLSEDERLRAARYRHDSDRLRFAVTRASLRTLLAARTGDPEYALQFSLGPCGKPALNGYPQISFNVTHSGPHALIAMSNARRVGIDVQVVDPSLRWRELLDIVCTDDERQALVSSSKDSQPQLFFRCWTAKEALLKLTGAGITEGLQSVSVDLFATGAQRLRAQPNENTQAASFFQFHWIAEFNDCVGCIAFEA